MTKWRIHKISCDPSPGHPSNGGRPFGTNGAAIASEKFHAGCSRSPDGLLQGGSQSMTDKKLDGLAKRRPGLLRSARNDGEGQREPRPALRGAVGTKQSSAF